MINIRKVDYPNIQALREFYLKEQNCQIRYDCCHWRNWSDCYLFFQDDRPVGYGSVKGMDKLTDRDSIFEFFLLPPFRNEAKKYYRELIRISGAKYAEAQTNDQLTSKMTLTFAKNVHSVVVLFGAGTSQEKLPRNLIFRKRKSTDQLFGDEQKERGDYVLEKKGKIVAGGGFLSHYNPPFADIFMEVDQANRRKGYGTAIVRELAKACISTEKIPAARCDVVNYASRATLRKAGLKIVATMIQGHF